MALVNTIDSAYELQQLFVAFNRENNFTFEGMEILYEYLEEYSEAIGEDLKIDIIALCCEYYESSIEELIDNYNIDISDADGDEEEIKEIVEGYLQENTSVCGETLGGFVYAAF